MRRYAELSDLTIEGVCTLTGVKAEFSFDYFTCDGQQYADEIKLTMLYVGVITFSRKVAVSMFQLPAIEHLEKSVTSTISDSVAAGDYDPALEAAE